MTGELAQCHAEFILTCTCMYTHTHALLQCHSHHYAHTVLRIDNYREELLRILYTVHKEQQKN